MFQRLLIFSGLIASLFIYGCKKELTPVEITAIHAYPDSVFPGDTVELVGGATSPEADYIKFVWFYQDQVLPQPLWIAPKEFGNQYVLLEASDQRSTDLDSVCVHVKDTMGTFIDPRNYHEYKWVKIGQQIWMAENLAYLGYLARPGDETKDDVPICYVYGYKGQYPAEAQRLESYDQYGVLYNHLAALFWCPPGWHLPTDYEYMELEIALGMSPNDVNFNTDRTSGGVARKLKSDTLWQENGNGDNLSGFNALPAGRKIGSKEFDRLGRTTIFWCSDTYDEARAMTRYLSYANDDVLRGPSWKSYGFSVRCIKDE